MGKGIFIADDHAVFRSGLRALLERESDCAVVGEAASFADIPARVLAAGADVLIIDLSMPGPGSAPQAVEAALEANPQLRVVVLTMHEDEYYLREMFRVGASGFVLKKSDASHVVGAVRAARRGERYVDPELAGAFLAAQAAPQSAPPVSSSTPLSTREQEVCHLLAVGHTNVEIAAKLHISQRTVEVHRRNIMSKLGAKSRAELVRFALDRGLLERR